MEEQLPLIEGLPKLEVKARPRSKYQQWKLENNYCKATDNQRCKNCKNMVEKEEANKYFCRMRLSGIMVCICFLSTV